jgi:SAM-dependent methyltransferase
MISGLKNAVKAVVPYRAYAPAQAFLRYFTSLRHAGGPFKCPLCQGNFSHFMPIGIDVPVLKEKHVVGAGYRLNASCPRCRSEDRERLIYLYLKLKTPDLFSRPTKLLHVAPEPSLSARLRACPSISYIAADLNSPMADVRMDITAIDETEGTYDVIICNHVLEHVEDDRKAMGELFRVLKPGGFAILQVPISYIMDETYEDFLIRDPKAREVAFGQCDHVRLYGNDYTHRLSQAGFNVMAVAPEKFLERSQIAAYRLLPAEKLFVCVKN